MPPFSPGPASTISKNPRAPPSLATSNMPTTGSKQLLNGEDTNTAKKTVIAPETASPKTLEQLIQCKEGTSQVRGCRGEPSSRRLRKQHLQRRRSRNGTPTTAVRTPKPRRELGLYPHAGEGRKTMRKRKTQIQAPPKRKQKQKKPQRPPPERHICVIVQPNNSGNRVVWSAPELHPPQLAIDCGVCIHPQRLLFECGWNVAVASKTRQPTISEVPLSPRDVGSNKD